jgi:hypothetical protein
MDVTGQFRLTATCISAVDKASNDMTIKVHPFLKVLWRLFLQSPLRNKRFWSEYRSSVMLSFSAAQSILTGTRSQDNFYGLSAVICACWVDKVIGYEGVEWVQLAQDRGQWRAVLNAMMNLRVLAPRISLVS